MDHLMYGTVACKKAPYPGAIILYKVKFGDVGYNNN